MDKKFVIGLGAAASLVLTTAGTVSGFWIGQAERDEKFSTAIAESKTSLFEALDLYKRDAEEKFATKQELAFFADTMGKVDRGVDKVNLRLDQFMQNVAIVKEANARLVKIQRRVSSVNENMADIKEQVEDQKALVQKALEKKKK